jgi:hypothetical protein
VTKSWKTLEGGGERLRVAVGSNLAAPAARLRGLYEDEREYPAPLAADARVAIRR